MKRLTDSSPRTNVGTFVLKGIVERALGDVGGLRVDLTASESVRLTLTSWKFS